MKTKKVISILLVLIILTAELGFISFSGFSSSTVIAATTTETEATQYFGKQLTGEAREIYNLMLEMYTNKIFMKGESYEITNIVAQSEIVGYTQGSQQLLNKVMAARDAFQYDVPGAFYIDFSALSLRVTQDTQGKYHAYIGAGRRDDYFLPGFTASNTASAVSKYNTELAKAVKEVKTAAGANANAEALTRAAHDWVTTHMNYKYEYQVENYKSTKTSYSNARTAYDCLIYGEGVCEAYTRGFKAIMDELGIPCVCVYGMYQEGVSGGEHIWNYVKIGEDWYGVDVTHDDPVGYGLRNSGKEHQQYCLIGALALDSHHVPIGTLSASGYEFNYPEVRYDVYSLGEKNYEIGGFKTRTEKVRFEGEDTIAVKVSYNGENDSQNSEKGTYMVMRVKQNQAAQYTDWYYVLGSWYPVLEGGYDEKSWYHDNLLGYYLYFPMPHYQAVQFAVTDIPPEVHEDATDPSQIQSFYMGNELLLKDMTQEFINDGKIYTAPPYIKSTTPVQQAKLSFGYTYNMTIEYNDVLRLPRENDPQTIATDETLEIEPVVFYPNNNTSGDKVGQIELVGWGLDSKGKKIDKSRSAGDSKLTITKMDLGELDENGNIVRNASISFTFTPDNNFAGGETVYHITWTGVVGEKSGKTPNYAEWCIGSKAYYCSICIANGGAAMIFGQPELLDSDLSGSSFTFEDGADPDLSSIDLSEISHRLSLVTTSTAEDIDEAMRNNLKDVSDIEDIKTYNVSLFACGSAIKAIDGVKLKVCIGFPDGTTYEDFITGGLKYKAYHYDHDEYGNLTGTYQEIEVEVVRQGLILYMDAFSPFAIATLKGDGKPVTEKKLVLSTTEGGAATVVSEIVKDENDKTGIIDMTRNSSIKVKVTADDGKVIDNIAVGGKTIKVTNNKEMTFDVKASDLDVGTSRIVVSFASKKVVDNVKKGETPVSVILPRFDQNQPIISYNSKIDVNSDNVIKSKLLNMTVSQFLLELDHAYSVTVSNKDNGTVENTENIGTGHEVKCGNKTYDMAIYGDINGDGNADFDDILEVNKHRLGKEALKGVNLTAGDVNEDNVVDFDDILQINKYRLGKIDAIDG